MSKYENLDREQLIRLLQRRDAERQLGLVWERDEIEAEAALNDDFVALTLDPELSFPPANDQAAKGGAGWRNLIIEGDNYDALRALRMSHKGAIRCIYIDPPYNTGNRDFVYNDRFVDKTHRFRHSLWLEFMYRRLELAKDLMAPEGVIILSIDDNEVFRLGMLCDRVFGEGNRIGVIVWKNVTDNNPSRVVTEHEYLLVYAKNKSVVAAEWKSKDVAKKDAMLDVEKELLDLHKDDAGLRRAYSAWFRVNKDQLTPLDNYKYIDRGGIYAGSRSVHNPGKEGYRYDVIHPVTKIACQQPLMGYRFPEDTMKDLLAKKRVLFGVDHTKLIELKLYLKDYRAKLSSLIELDGRAGPNELKRIFGDEKVFSNPKPVSLLSELLSYVTSGSDTVLDFFAGSGTTAQAVAELNAEDGGSRKFILVSSTEATQEQPDKNLCRDVCAERVRRVMKGYVDSKGDKIDGIGGDFAYLRARRIPKHRLTLKLQHDEVWSALQLLHDRPLTQWPGGWFCANGNLAYLAQFRDAALAKLHEWREVITSERILYCWAPERLREAMPGIDLRPIPQYLRDRFGR